MTSWTYTANNVKKNKENWWILGDSLLWGIWSGGWKSSKAWDMIDEFWKELKNTYNEMNDTLSEHQKNYDKLTDNIKKIENEYDKLRDKAKKTREDAEKSLKKYNEELEKSQSEWFEKLGERYVELQEKRREIDNQFLKEKIGDISDSDWLRIRDEGYTFYGYTYDELKEVKEIFDEIKLIEENTTEEQRKFAEFTEKTSKAQEILNQMKEKEAELEEKKAAAIEKQAIAQAMMDQENWKNYIRTLTKNGEDIGTWYYNVTEEKREQIQNLENIEYAKQLENQATSLNDQLKQLQEEKDKEVEILTNITARKIQLEDKYNKTFQENISKQKQSVDELIVKRDQLIAKKNEYYNSSVSSRRAYWWTLNSWVTLVGENWPEAIVSRVSGYVQPRNASNTYSTVNNNNSNSLTINWMQNTYGSIDEMLDDLRQKLTYRN